jgi:acyl CoA:acetate/3-ketoacid CoA transferase beta subunit
LVKKILTNLAVLEVPDKYSSLFEQSPEVAVEEIEKEFNSKGKCLK